MISREYEREIWSQKHYMGRDWGDTACCSVVCQILDCAPYLISAKNPQNRMTIK